MIPVSVPDLRGREIELLTQCVDDNWVSSAGPLIGIFEQEIARIAEAEYSVAICNGSCALEIALRAIGVERGDLVALPDWTFAATANAIHHVGAIPYFVDVEADSWCLSTASLASAIERSDKPIKAVIPVHALGHPADMKPILDLAREAGMAVVEDAAGALGSRYRGRSVGALGTAGIFSFNGNKIATAGSGGMVVTRDRAIYERAKSLIAQGRSGDRYQHHEIAFNYRMSNVNAAIGLAQLERLEEMTARRRAIFSRYADALKDHPLLDFAPVLSWAQSNCWMSALRCRTATLAADILVRLGEAGVGAMLFWENLSDQPAYARFPRTSVDTSRSLSRSVLALPCSSNLRTEDQDRVIQVLLQTAQA